MERSAAVDRVVEIVRTVETDPMPVPIREIWVLGDVALGLDPLDRLDVYLTKDLYFRGEGETDADDLDDRFGVTGIGKTVSPAWAASFPEHLRTNDSGHIAPERCLAAHLLADDEPIHLEVCNTGFEHNVTQRLEGALATERYERILDPRGVCVWIDGQWSETAIEKLREGAFAFPPLPKALEMLGVDPATAEAAASAIEEFRGADDGASVRGDVL